MESRLTRIGIGARDIPIKCDNIVLCRLQEEYGSLDAFENKLLGLELVLDEDGYPIRDDEGKRKKRKVEADVSACMRFLTLCAEEGLEIAGEEPVDEKALMRAAGNPFKLVLELHREFLRAFESGSEKKQQPSRSKKS